MARNMGRWRMKPGQGKHYEDGRVFSKAGDEMNHEPSPAGLHKFECVTPEDPPGPRRNAPWMRPRADGLFDVINPSSGKPLNDSPLTLDDAKQLVDGEPKA